MENLEKTMLARGRELVRAGGCVVAFIDGSNGEVVPFTVL
jgi:hypothetical protein